MRGAGKVKQDKKGVINFLIAVAVVLAVFVVFLTVTNQSTKEKIYEACLQDTYEAAFYCYTFDMEAVSDPPVYEKSPTPCWGFWPAVFSRVEYVMEFPPEERRGWAVIYIKPGMATASSVAVLDDIVYRDPSIEIDKRLTLPLTVEQVLTYPDAVLNIIKQLDREQWESFYSGKKIMRPEVEMLARNAGIEVPA